MMALPSPDSATLDTPSREPAPMARSTPNWVVTSSSAHAAQRRWKTYDRPRRRLEDRSDGREGGPAAGFGSSSGYAGAPLRSCHYDALQIDAESPITDAINIYRAAKPLIDQKGEEAAAFAGGHADLLLEGGDLDGSAVWRRIRTAIEELL